MFEKIVVPKELIPSDPRFGAGPSLIPSEHINILLKKNRDLLGTSHRQLPFKNFVRELYEDIRTYFNLPTDYKILFGNGGATLLFNMIPLGLVKEKSLHFVCGAFSERWYKYSLETPYITTKKIDIEYDKMPNISDIKLFDEMNEKEKFANADLLAFTQLETSIGFELKSIPAKTNNQLIAIDATSSAGVLPCDFNNTDIHFWSLQKIFSSDGGTWMSILSPPAVERINQIETDKKRFIPHFMRWSEYINNNDKFESFNTPSIINLVLFHEQLKKLKAIGAQRVLAETVEKANYLYDWAQNHKHLSPLIENEFFRAQTVATIKIDSKIPADELTKYLREKNLVYGIGGYRSVAKKINHIRIALFPSINFEDLKRLTKLIDFLLDNV
ncbi:MAG: phosphoserine transaminase [Oligoflexia bacterium]|nr:phosphoserine transaminase [Oligoflexia bacterium]